MKFAEMLEKRKDASDIIKEFKKNKIIVKMADYDTLVGRMDSEQDAIDVMEKFNFMYQVRTGTEDKGLVYIELNGSMDESKEKKSDLKKELKSFNKMMSYPDFKDRPDMMKILQRVAEIQEILNESYNKEFGAMYYKAKESKDIEQIHGNSDFIIKFTYDEIDYEYTMKDSSTKGIEKEFGKILNSGILPSGTNNSIDKQVSKIKISDCKNFDYEIN